MFPNINLPENHPNNHVLWVGDGGRRHDLDLVRAPVFNVIANQIREIWARINFQPQQWPEIPDNGAGWASF